jgi:hypothetical protein
MAQNNDNYLPVIAVVAFIWIADSVGTSDWFNKGWYSLRYFVSPTEIHVGVRPQDCDFMHAPLGSKGCRYDAAVSAYNAAGDLVGGEGAPEYSRDSKTGKPIISWDNGKTWTWMAVADLPDQKIKNVNVSWVKHPD